MLRCQRTLNPNKWNGINCSHFEVFTRVVPLFSIQLRVGEFSRRSVKKKTRADVFSDAVSIRCGVVTNISLHGVNVKCST